MSEGACWATNRWDNWCKLYEIVKSSIFEKNYFVLKQRVKPREKGAGQAMSARCAMPIAEEPVSLLQVNESYVHLDTITLKLKNHTALINWKIKKKNSFS